MASQLIEVKGLSQIRDRMLKFPKRIQGRVLDKAMRAGAKVIAAEVRQRAPVKTGAIQRNVLAKRGDRRFKGESDSRFIVGVQHGKARTRETKWTSKTGKTRTNRLTKYDKRGEDPFYYRFQERGFHAVGRVAKGKGAWSRAKRRLRTRNARFIPGKKFIGGGFAAAAPRALGEITRVLTAEVAKLT